MPSPLHANTPFRLSSVDEAVLHTLTLHPLLTSERVCRLRYKAGSLSYVRKHCKLLKDQGYIRSHPLPHPFQAGRPWEVYSLDTKGVAYLRQLGVPIKPTQVREASPHMLLHSLLVSDLLIAASLLPQCAPQVRVNALHHAWHFQKRPVVPTFQERKGTIIPDGWVEFRLGEQEPVGILLEVDEGREDCLPFQRKIEALLRFARGPALDLFGTRTVTIAIVAASSEDRTRRACELLRWTEQLLAERQLTEEAKLFRFLALPSVLDPQELFLAPIWCRPFDAQPQPVL